MNGTEQSRDVIVPERSQRVNMLCADLHSLPAMDALVIVCSCNANASMVRAWML